jgi:hypothetical protein
MLVDVATVETLHATSLHHQTVAYAWTVHQLCCMRAPPNPVRCRAIYHRRMGICVFVGIATVETLHATSLHHRAVAYALTVHQLYYMRAPPNPVRHCAIYHRRMGICAFVGIATVETLHATSLHPRAVAHVWTVHQLYCVRAPPNPMRHRAIYHRRIFICTFVGIATVETLHATSLHHRTVACA